MAKDMNCNLFYSKWYYLLLLIVGSSMMIGVLFSIVLGLEITLLRVFFQSIFSTAFLWGGCVLIVTYSWRKFPWERMPVKHLIIEVSLILLLLLVFLLSANAIMCFKEKSHFWQSFAKHSNQVVLTLLITFLITTIHEAVFFYQQWKLNFSKSVSLEKDNLEARYNALKAQVNPHFLFNSLNSLMSLLENNPKAEQYVQDLSDFLRYVLLSSEQKAVTLNQEIENLEKYINLQKLRFGDNLNTNISINKDALQMQIPPLVLQMLFENCIKHNVISSQHPLTIDIFDQANTITVRNNLQRKLTKESTGQGLKNIEGRYRFIANEPIRIEEDKTTFSVIVPLITKTNND